MAENYSYFRGRQSTLEGLTHKTKRDPNEYHANYNDGDGGVYQSIIRFIPIPEGITASNKDYMFKYVTWLTNPQTQEKRCIDNPTTVGDSKNVMDNLMWALLMSNDPTKKQIAKDNMRRTEQYIALVQVINDPKHPEYNNRIMYMRFGNSINDKLVQELSPNQSLGITYPSPFDLINGRLFNLVITSKNGQNDYSQSRFIDSVPNLPSGMRYLNAQGTYSVISENSPESEYPYVHQYLLSQVSKIDLAKHEYHEWDESTSQFVNDAISVIAEYAQTGVLPQNSILTQKAQTVNPASFIPPTATIPQAPVVNQVQSYAPQAPVAPPVPSAPQMPQMPTSAPITQGIGIQGVPVPPTAQVNTAVPEQPEVTKTTGSRFGDLTDVIY